MTYTLMTCDCRLPTIVCRGNPESAHKLVTSALTHLFRQAFIKKMSEELILMTLLRQKEMRNTNVQAKREAAQAANREAAQAEPQVQP